MCRLQPNICNPTQIQLHPSIGRRIHGHSVKDSLLLQPVHLIELNLSRCTCYQDLVIRLGPQCSNRNDEHSDHSLQLLRAIAERDKAS